MGFFNPFQQMQMQPQNFRGAQRPQIDQAQFRQVAMTLNDNALAQLVQLARQQGISDADIQAGINFIRSL